MGITARRNLITGAMAGGLLTAGVAPADAATRAVLLPARKLKPGDLVVGPRSTVVRIASRKRLGNGRQRLRYTDPGTGAATAFDEVTETMGYAASHRFVVLARGVPGDAVRMATPAAAPTPIDGGTP